MTIGEQIFELCYIIGDQIENMSVAHLLECIDLRR